MGVAVPRLEITLLGISMFWMERHDLLQCIDISVSMHSDLILVKGMVLERRKIILIMI